MTRKIENLYWNTLKTRLEEVQAELMEQTSERNFSHESLNMIESIASEGVELWANKAAKLAQIVTYWQRRLPLVG